MDSKEKLYGVDIVFPCLSFFFLFFILFIAHAARGRIGKYNKTWSVFFVTFTSVNRKRNNICHSR